MTDNNSSASENTNSNESASEKEQREHKEAMQTTQKVVRDKIKAAKEKRGVVIYLWGNGKGKSSSGFGTLLRAVGHGQRAAIIQFIKGTWKTGEEAFFRDHPSVEHHIMGTGFTWDSQDKQKDIAAAQEVWLKAEQCLASEDINLVLMDEITYMFDYGYLSLETCIAAIKNRPLKQNVILTGRSPIAELIELADTVSEIREVKHAFHAGVKAQKGIEF
ncbi:cob(I)yrinic acid a,c-diamide adenosyltransferase [Saccharophagus degradans]|uniref:Corrinoid adenosyltransferase n=1 Tax=Saccharophagus degradans (strain 2-40 / ATCC 43961 / DSM 17024) TaxID=203122 RepID=Q21N38_SACD2|nr:cob(I)yrinic acid a,c-diamide adenosyltransferase [Saccharophagus degradans]ABD79891.1 cob(I)yrinic acid a,c-diamide adenosyltransferase / PAS/PAC sensor signal transduction histidine kinase [Saccharophagus degradans 2-40]